VTAIRLERNISKTAGDRDSILKVQSRFAETRFAETLTLNPNPNFGESGFGESGRHHSKGPPIGNDLGLWGIKCDMRQYGRLS